jgi:hypothetical protein
VLNNLIVVGENIRPVASHSTYLLDLQIKNSSAMTALLQGRANKRDVDILIAMSNIVEALQRKGFGRDYADVAVDGREAILKIVWRAVDKLRFVPTGPEIQALNRLMELHDAQMEAITVKDLDEAIVLAKRLIKDKHAAMLPAVPQELRA